MTLHDFFKKEVPKHHDPTRQTGQSSLLFLQVFFPEGVMLYELTVSACNGYKDFLLHARGRQRKKKESISRNTALSYFNKFKAAFLKLQWGWYMLR